MRLMLMPFLMFGASSAFADDGRLPLFHGVWASPAEACALRDNPQTAIQRHWEGVFIEIGPGTVSFYEAACSIMSAEHGEGGRWIASLQCTGEGEVSEHTWQIVKHDAHSFSIAETDLRYELCR
jgi:hypothetical protein